MASANLSRRTLGRATLARQMLLGREKVLPLRAIERLIGLQAQWPKPPFVGLWSRIEDFRRESLNRLLARREVVRSTMMRGTLHLTTAKDYIDLRTSIQPALTHGLLSVLRDRAKGIDVDALVATAREYFVEKPRPFDELRTFLSARGGKGDVRAMAYAVRMHLPLVQVPTTADWGFPATADFAVAESWLGEPLRHSDGPEALILRYLAAFGPATATDMQTWSGLRDLKPAFEAVRSKLLVLRGERGGELFDLPKAPRPPEDAAAPARFLPEFDNVLLSHVDRTRIIAKEHRSSVFLPGLRVAPTFLVDGLVAGTWAIERAKGAASLVIAPFAAIPKKAREELAEEGDALVRFVEHDARNFALRFTRSR
jgi:hypothetical protein